MRHYLAILSIAAAALIPASATPLIVAAEYFINEDPGLGNGTPVVIAEPGSAVSLAVSIPASTIAVLPDGLHRLTCRVVDENDNWAVSYTRTFRKEPPAEPEPETYIARIEYQWFYENAPVCDPFVLTPSPESASASFTVLAGLQGLSDGTTYQLVATPFNNLGNRGISATHQILIETTDSDGDGLPDHWEITHNLNPNDPTDADLESVGGGLTNIEEFLAGTNPTLSDTSGDGLSDSFLIAIGLDPTIQHPGLRDTILSRSPSEFGFVTENQVRSISPSQPLLTRNPDTGKFTLQMGVQRSDSLSTWQALHLSEIESSFYNGVLIHTFDSLDDTQFYRVSVEE